MHNRSATIISIVSAFAVGSLIGAGVALLTAPQAGTDTRRMIREKSNEIKDKAAGTIGDTRDRASRAVSNLVDKTRKTTSRIGSRAQKKLEAAQKA